MKSKSNQILLVLLLISLICSCARNVGDGELVYKLSTPENCNFLNESIKVSYEIVQPQASCMDAFMSSIDKVVEYKGRLFIMAAETNPIYRTNTIFNS